MHIFTLWSSNRSYYKMANLGPASIIVMGVQASCLQVYLFLGQILQPHLSFWWSLLPLRLGHEIKFKIMLGVSARVGTHPFINIKHSVLCCDSCLTFCQLGIFLWQLHYIFIRSPCFP